MYTSLSLTVHVVWNSFRLKLYNVRPALLVECRYFFFTVYRVIERFLISWCYIVISIFHLDQSFIIGSGLLPPGDFWQGTYCIYFWIMWLCRECKLIRYYELFCPFDRKRKIYNQRMIRWFSHSSSFKVINNLLKIISLVTWILKAKQRSSVVTWVWSSHQFFHSMISNQSWMDSILYFMRVWQQFSKNY